VARLAARPLSWLALAFGALWMPLAHGESPWRGDVLGRTAPWRHFVRQRLRAGEFPGWCDTLGAGAPTFGLTQPGVFDPLALPGWVLPPPWGIGLQALTSHALFTVGVWAWLRTLGSDDDDATAGAAVAGLSGFVVSTHFTAAPVVMGIAWTPWALHHLARAARDGDGRAWVWASLCLAAPVLAGDPMGTVLAALIAVAQALGEEAVTARRRALRGVGLALLGALGLSAAQWLPALAANATEVFRAAPAWQAGLSPRRLIELVVPGFFGEAHTADWFLPGLYGDGRRTVGVPWAAGIYLGAVTLPLAATAVARASRARRDVAFGLAVVALSAVSLGHHTPLWGAVSRALPPLRWLMRPEGYLGAVTLLVAALAARALPDARRRVDLAARVSGAMSVALLLLAALMFLRGSRLARGVVRPLPVFPPVVHDIVFTAASHAAAWLLAFHAIALLAQHGRLTAARARASLLGLMILELFINALSLPAWAPSAVVGGASAMERVLRAGASSGEVTRVLRLVDAVQDDDLTGAAGFAGTLLPNLGADRGIAHLNPSRATLDREEYAWHLLARRDPQRLMRLHGARFALMPMSVIVARLPSLRPVARYEHTPWVVAVDDTPAPAAFVAGRVQAARSAQAAREVIVCAGTFNTPQVLMLSGIGPAEQLEAHGIPVLADLPVGRNLQDHVAVALTFSRLAPGPFQAELRADRMAASMLRAWLTGTGPATMLPSALYAFVKSDPQLEVPDIEFMFRCAPQKPAMWFPLLRPAGDDGYGIRPALLHPRSRGEVTLRSADPADRVRILFNLLSDAHDIAMVFTDVRHFRH
jgi:hypothetical protein